MTHDITERIAAATGATDISVQASDAYDIPEDSYLLEMSSPDGVIALRCKLTQAGFDVLYLVKLPGNKARGRIVPPATPAPTFAVGDAVEAAVNIKWGFDAHIWHGTVGRIRNLEPGRQKWAVVFPSEEICITCYSHELRPATVDAPDAWNPEPAEGGEVLADDEPMTWEGKPVKQRLSDHKAVIASSDLWAIHEAVSAAGFVGSEYTGVSGIIRAIEESAERRRAMPQTVIRAKTLEAEHAAVVAERDALREAVATARAAIAHEVHLLDQRIAEDEGHDFSAAAHKQAALKWALRQLPKE